MHELTLIHTDLKPENILLVSTEYVKVPDYKVCGYIKSSRSVETVTGRSMKLAHFDRGPTHLV